MDRMRKKKQGYSQLPFGYYHLCTDRLKGRNLFDTIRQYIMGMATIALLTLKFNIKIYAFELMPNHLHIILSATGATCVKAFSYIRRRLSLGLELEGKQALPKDYGFVLIPIASEEEMRKQIIYTVRNPYEKNSCVPGGHRWGSGYLLFNEFAKHIRGKRVGELSAAEVERFTHCRDVKLPRNWEIHPELGVLPSNYVQIGKVEALFSSVKDYQTRLVKDYESYVRISGSLGEEMELSREEVLDLAAQYVRKNYNGRLIKSLSRDEKCCAAVELNAQYNLSPLQLSDALFLPERIIIQAIRSKDYRMSL